MTEKENETDLFEYLKYHPKDYEIPEDSITLSGVNPALVPRWINIF